jgi:hypothetical protein
MHPLAAAALTEPGAWRIRSLGGILDKFIRFGKPDPPALLEILQGDNIARGREGNENNTILQMPQAVAP